MSNCHPVSFKVRTVGNAHRGILNRVRVCVCVRREGCEGVGGGGWGGGG